MKTINTRSVVVILFVVGVFVLAVIDINFRATFADIAKIRIGGYLGQLYPQQRST